MGARQKLNRAFFNGSLVVAALVGLATESWLAFALVLGVLLASNLICNEIRPRWQRRGQDDGRVRIRHPGKEQR